MQYNNSKKGDIAMKQFFIKYNKKIDSVSSTALLYFLIVWILNYLCSPLYAVNEILYIIIIVCVPAIIVSLKSIRNSFNKLLRWVFGFRR